MIRRKIDLKWASLLLVELHKSIHYKKVDDKDIGNATNLVKELVQYFLEWGTNKRLCQNHV